jgi:tight adherence protein C
MVYLAVISLALTVGLTVFLVAEMLPGRSRTLRQRLAEVEALPSDPYGLPAKRDRMMRRQKIMDFLEGLGGRIQPGAVDGDRGDRLFLVQAGYRHPSAPAIYWGLRLALTLGLGAGAFTLAPTLFGASGAVTMLVGVYFAAMGWVAPVFIVRSKKNARQKDLQKALADALDLMVVCVEAGLGLNQALMRVAQEIGHVSILMSQELVTVNAEIRAGAPREDALHHLADRTGLEDVRALVTMLIQTDRFGTSIAKALRVHSDTLRQKRRQRAEEAAAKTAIKLVFPLVTCIFPALFVVLIGPGLMLIFRALGGIL